MQIRIVTAFGIMSEIVLILLNNLGTYNISITSSVVANIIKAKSDFP